MGAQAGPPGYFGNVNCREWALAERSVFAWGRCQEERPRQAATRTRSGTEFADGVSQREDRV